MQVLLIKTSEGGDWDFDWRLIGNLGAVDILMTSFLIHEHVTVP